MLEKSEKLEEIERKNEERRNQLIKKMQRMDKRRDQYIKEKNDKIMELKVLREEKNKNCQEKKDEMNKDEIERRNDILLYQIETMNRSMQKTLRASKSRNKNEDPIKTQIKIYDSLPAFKKRMNKIKSLSVSTKSKEEKYKIYKEIKRKENERKKKEKEDEMFNKMLK